MRLLAMKPVLLSALLCSVLLCGCNAVKQSASTLTVPAQTSVTATVAVGTFPDAVAVNSNTNQIYVVNNNASGSSGSVTVIDGATNDTTTVAAGVLPYAVAVNPNTITGETSQITTATEGDRDRRGNE